MIHNFDTHYWLGKLEDGRWISMDRYMSSEAIFSTVQVLRMEPLSQASYPVIFEVAKPPGYTLFWRARVHQEMGAGSVVAMEYVIGIEKGGWTAKRAAGFNLDLEEIPIKFPVVDGFRAILQYDGSFGFFSSENWGYTQGKEGLNIVYKFGKIIRSE